jgi:hypothetical protein
MPNPRKKGYLAMDRAGNPIIIAENKKGYKFDRGIVAIWDNCDGTRSEAQLIKDLANSTGGKTSKVGRIVPMILAKLRQFDLIEYI